MTDPRVGEIEARHRVIRRCLEAHPNDSYDMSDLDWAVEEAKDDVPYLLAELRKAHEALLLHESFRDLIMSLAEKWEVEFPSKAADLRAAVAAANGDGRD